jgi:hypothetical protein
MKLKAAKRYTDPGLRFLHDYTYDLGEDGLLKFGAVECALSVTHQLKMGLISKETGLLLQEKKRFRAIGTWSVKITCHSYEPRAPNV